MRQFEVSGGSETSSGPLAITRAPFVWKTVSGRRAGTAGCRLRNFTERPSRTPARIDKFSRSPRKLPSLAEAAAVVAVHQVHARPPLQNRRNSVQNQQEFKKCAGYCSA